MRRLLCLLLLSAGPLAPPSTPRANFLYITVSANHSTPVHAIWRPNVGAVGDGYAQQTALFDRERLPGAQDSMRRWRDPASRDTIAVQTPVGFTVDMTPGPIVIEAVGTDSIRVEAQLTPSRGPVVGSWGHVFVISADGVTPAVERRR